MLTKFICGNGSNYTKKAYEFSGYRILYERVITSSSDGLIFHRKDDRANHPSNFQGICPSFYSG